MLAGDTVDLPGEVLDDAKPTAEQKSRMTDAQVGGWGGGAEGGGGAGLLAGGLQSSSAALEPCEVKFAALPCIVR